MTTDATQTGPVETANTQPGTRPSWGSKPVASAPTNAADDVQTDNESDDDKSNSDAQQPTPETPVLVAESNDNETHEKEAAATVTAIEDDKTDTSDSETDPATLDSGGTSLEGDSGGSATSVIENDVTNPGVTCDANTGEVIGTMVPIFYLD